MKAFTVYRHPLLAPQAVKRGFSWPALFFSFFWLLAARLWWRAAIWAVVYLLLGFALDLFAVDDDESAVSGSDLLAMLMLAGLQLVPAFRANAWRAADLLQRGFVAAASVEAETKDAALAKAASAIGSGAARSGGEMPAPLPAEAAPAEASDPVPTPAQAPPRKGMRDMVIGGLWAAGGAAVTIATYSASASGGRYVVAWGAIIFGAFQFVRGLVEFLSVKH